MKPLRELLGDHPDMYTMAEDGDLRTSVYAWWHSGIRQGSISDILLLRACAELGILPEGVNATEVITRESSRTFARESKSWAEASRKARELRILGLGKETASESE